jgi:hypothetical protein
MIDRDRAEAILEIWLNPGDLFDCLAGLRAELGTTDGGMQCERMNCGRGRVPMRLGRVCASCRGDLANDTLSIHRS